MVVKKKLPRHEAYHNCGPYSVVFTLCEHCNEILWRHVNRKCLFTFTQWTPGLNGLLLVTERTIKSASKLCSYISEMERPALNQSWRHHYRREFFIGTRRMEMEETMYWLYYLLAKGWL